MPSAPHAQRSNVVTRALVHGWAHDSAVFDGGDIIRDTFASDIGVVRVVWLKTPWSASGRWAGALFSEKATKKDRNVWAVSGWHGLLDLLSSLTVPPATDGAPSP